MGEGFPLHILSKTDTLRPRRKGMCSPPLHCKQGESGWDPSQGSKGMEAPEASSLSSSRGSCWWGHPLSSPCSPASAKAAAGSAAARTIVIILINPLHAEYCGLLAGPSHAISISCQAGGSQIAHAGECFAEQTGTNLALAAPSAQSACPPGGGPLSPQNTHLTAASSRVVIGRG